MQAILLCAGVSSRMAPISDKILLTFCGKSLFEHQVSNIIECGINDFVVVCNKMNISELQKIGSKMNKIKFDFIVQKKPEDGIKGALDSCVKLIKDQVFIINSNDFVDKKVYIEIKKLIQDKKYKSVICGKTVDKYFPGGYIKVDNKGILKSIVEKPKPGNEPSNMVNILIHVFNDFHSFYTYVEKESNKNDNAYENALQKYSQKNNVYVYCYSGKWETIKYPWHILDVQKNLLEKISKQYIALSAQISKHSIIDGNVYISENVKVFENAIIKGPCYIGANSIIGNNSLVRESIIGENVVIGFNSEITRSFLHKNIWTHQNYIGDSIIDENVSFGAGTVIGNLRLDEKNIMVNIKNEKIDSQRNKLGSIIGSGSRLGINCSVNPGIKIGKNVFITSGIVIHTDVDNNNFYSTKFTQIIKENKFEVDVNNRDSGIK